MKCKLCLQEKRLIKKSHIIPDFMYKGIFDDKHKIVQKDFLNSRESFPSDGIYDKHILCAKCDNEIINSYESYAAKELFKPTMHEFIGALKHKVNGFYGDTTSVTMSGIDYKKAKLFFLSILWRSSISSHIFCKFVNLEPAVSEMIRKILYENDAGRNDSFKTSMAVFIPDGTRPYFTIGTPRMIPFDGNASYYAFIINSILLFINVNEHNKNELFNNGSLNENGEMTIWILMRDAAHDMFDGLIGRDINYNGPFRQ